MFFDQFIGLLTCLALLFLLKNNKCRKLILSKNFNFHLYLHHIPKCGSGDHQQKGKTRKKKREMPPSARKILCSGTRVGRVLWRLRGNFIPTIGHRAFPNTSFRERSLLHVSSSSLHPNVHVISYYWEMTHLWRKFGGFVYFSDCVEGI